MKRIHAAARAAGKPAMIVALDHDDGRRLLAEGYQALLVISGPLIVNAARSFLQVLRSFSHRGGHSYAQRPGTERAASRSMSYPSPPPGPGQVLVAVHTAGICGSDIHATQGLFPLTHPRVMGAEYSGTVLAAGRGVSRRLVGQAVACEPNYGCGACDDCPARAASASASTPCGWAASRSGWCSPGTACTPSRKDSTSPRRPSPSPRPAASRGSRWARMRRGATVVVIGGGIMGLLTLALAKARGAGTAILSDPVASRREAAGRLGADVTVDPSHRGTWPGSWTARPVAGASTSPARRSESRSSWRRARGLVRPRGVVQLVGVYARREAPFPSTSSISTSAS